MPADRTVTGLLDLSHDLRDVSTLLAEALIGVSRVFDEALDSDLPPVARLTRHVERYRGKMVRPTLTILAALASHPSVHAGVPSLRGGGGASSPEGGGAESSRRRGASSPEGGGAESSRRRGASSPEGGGAESSRRRGASSPEGGGAESSRRRGASSPPHSIITPDLLRAAAVCEMVHMATLVHDDVLDEADTRRLGQTVNSLHGNEAAVMLGDLLLAAAYEQCSLLPDKEPSLLIARASVVMCGGELLQLHHRADWSLDEPTYFEIINRKTGELIAASATMGALLVGAAPEHRDALAAFARDVGAAFQIQDDLLDLRGDERVVGKSLGRDLQKGKLTLPIIHHLAAASPIIRGRSLRLLDDAHGCKSAQQLTGITRELLHAIYQTESVRHAASEASALVHRAVQRLDQIPESPAREALRRLAEAVIDRDY